MKTRKIRVTAKKIDELMTLFRAMPAEPVGAHLSDDEFIGYATEALSTEEMQRIDEHLASCLDCTVEIERLLETSKVWQGEQGKQRLAALRQRVFGTSTLWERLRAFLEPFSYPLALQPEFFAPREPLEMESQDKTCGLFIEEKPNRDVIVRLDATTAALAGATICLSAGSWQREVRLEPATADEVEVEVVITRAERAALPPGTELHAALKGPPPSPAAA